MSEATMGAAPAAPGLPVKAENTATPAQIDQWEAEALKAIDASRDFEAAEDVLQRTRAVESVVRIKNLGQEYQARWQRVVLKAERRYGELLPPKTTGGRPRKETVSAANGSTGAKRVAQFQARKVAEVPREEFDKYVESEPEPSRAGLLRTANKSADHSHQTKAARAPKSNLDQNAEVVAWVKRQRERGFNRDAIVTASKAGSDGWPLPGVALSNGTFSKVTRAIESGITASKTKARARRREQREAKSRIERLADELDIRSKAMLQIQKINLLAVNLQVELHNLEPMEIAAIKSKQVQSLLDNCFADLVNLMEVLDLSLGEFQMRASKQKWQSTIDKLENRRYGDGGSEAEVDTAHALAQKMRRKGPPKALKAAS